MIFNKCFLVLKNILVETVRNFQMIRYVTLSEGQTHSSNLIALSS